MREVGWTPRVVAMDVFDWLASRDATRWDVVFANLFLHHFSDAALRSDCSGNRGAHVACSSAASPGAPCLALAGSHLVGLLGAGPVTRQDAVSSVHAGFRAQELSNLWPDPQDWVLTSIPRACSVTVFLPAGRSGR